MDQAELLDLPNDKLVAMVIQLREENAQHSRNISYIVEQWKLHSIKTDELRSMYLKVEGERDSLCKELTDFKQKFERTSVLLDLTERARNNLELTNKGLSARIEEAAAKRNIDSSLDVSEEDDREGVVTFLSNAENPRDSETSEWKNTVANLKTVIEKKDLDISYLKGSILRLKGSVRSYQSLKEALEKRVAVMESTCSSQICEMQALQLEVEDQSQQMKTVCLEKRRLDKEIWRLNHLLEEHGQTQEIVGMQKEEILTLRHNAFVARQESLSEKARLLALLNSSRPEDGLRIRELQFELIAARGNRNHWESKVSLRASFHS